MSNEETVRSEKATEIVSLYKNLVNCEATATAIIPFLDKLVKLDAHWQAKAVLSHVAINRLIYEFSQKERKAVLSNRFFNDLGEEILLWKKKNA